MTEITDLSSQATADKRTLEDRGFTVQVRRSGGNFVLAWSFACILLRRPSLIECVVIQGHHIPGGEVEYRFDRCYYFWFFGYVVKLPYERELES